MSYWLNSGFQERMISGPVVNAVCLLGCGRTRFLHIFVVGLFLYVGRSGELVLPYSQTIGNGRVQNQTLWERRNECGWKKCVRALGVR